jgi:hypothetical protein
LWAGRDPGDDRIVGRERAPVGVEGIAVFQCGLPVRSSSAVGRSGASPAARPSGKKTMNSPPIRDPRRTPLTQTRATAGGSAAVQASMPKQWKLTGNGRSLSGMSHAARMREWAPSSPTV